MTSAPSRLIPLRYDGMCKPCGVGLHAGTLAWWDRAARSVSCSACHDATAAVRSDLTTGQPSPTPGDPSQPDAPNRVAPGADPQMLVPPELGPAGGSADREYRRRRDGRENRIRATHPHVGGLILALSDEPQSTTAWATGAEGERRVGARLDALESDGIVVMHDRRIPGTRANIDHLAVGPAGVYVIDAKRYRGQVAAKDVGGWRSSDVRLYVDGRDRTRLVEGMGRQVAVVTAVLGGLAADAYVDVIPVLCFVDADWGWLAKPLRIGGVHICWPKATAELVRRPGSLDAAQIAALADHLTRSLPLA